jgi:hypothetical protein
MSRSYTPLTPSASMACRGTALLYLILNYYFSGGFISYDVDYSSSYLHTILSCILHSFPFILISQT